MRDLSQCATQIDKNAATRVGLPDAAAFLPISRQDMESRGWTEYDFLMVTGDSYVDHPSFGISIISRLLESEGYRVAVLAQPSWTDERDFAAFGAPRIAVLVSSGNIDAMVAHYTVAKRRRSTDYYTAGGKMGKRPDRALKTYVSLAKAAFPGVPTLIGGLEASLRRFAHYDYWDDRVLPSILADSGADILMYGMGELSVTELARRLERGERAEKLTDIRGTCYMAGELPKSRFTLVECAPYEKCASDKREYAKACRLQYREQDFTSETAIFQRHGKGDSMRFLVQNPPSRPLTTAELDSIYELPYARYYHPSYETEGGVAAIEEVEFSITHNRGCIGGCTFCSLAFHQGRFIQSRSIESVVREAERLTHSPRFKGYIHDVGGPTANFRQPSCEKQKKLGLCRDRVCLAPEPCPSLIADHSEYIELLRRLREIPGVKKVFVRSGVRFDYVMYDKKHGDEFLRELVQYHVSGQLKVAPEHCSDHVLSCMNKPPFQVFKDFQKRYEELNRRCGMKQYLVPYLMSSHPGSTLDDAVELTKYLDETHRNPEQVQDFYPTPGTIATCMYYTGIDPRTMKEIYVSKNAEEKAMQRALLQWKRPENRDLVRKALRITGHTELLKTLLNESCPDAARQKGKHKSFTRRK